MKKKNYITPGQYMHILPVVAMCGHLCGLDITATGIIPLAVRTGFAFKRGSNFVLYASGIALIISTNFGIFDSWFLAAISCFSYF